MTDFTHIEAFVLTWVIRSLKSLRWPVDRICWLFSERNIRRVYEMPED